MLHDVLPNSVCGSYPSILIVALIKIKLHAGIVLMSIGLLLASSPLCYSQEDQFVACLDRQVFDLKDSAQTLREATVQCYVLIFFSETCPICRKYSPWLRQFYEARSKQGVKVVLVFPDSATTVKDIETFRHVYRCPIPCLRDPHHAITDCVDARITPEAVVLDSVGTMCYEGRIDNLFVAPGKMRSLVSTHELDDAVNAVLSRGTVLVKSRAAVGCYIERRKNK